MDGAPAESFSRTEGLPRMEDEARLVVHAHEIDAEAGVEQGDVGGNGLAEDGDACLRVLYGQGAELGGDGVLISPAGPNPNNLNTAYYQSFNIERRYINFAVKLGAGGEAFPTQYGSSSLSLTGARRDLADDDGEADDVGAALLPFGDV